MLRSVLGSGTLENSYGRRQRGASLPVLLTAEREHGRVFIAIYGMVHGHP